MAELRYDRLYRTPSSEAFLVSEGEDLVARIELHYGLSVVHGLLLLERPHAEPEILALIGQIDDDLVWTAGVARDDFLVSVYTGDDRGTYDDSSRPGRPRGDSPNGGDHGD